MTCTTPNCENEMKDKPIIFSGESVPAILEGRKTQTRRVVSKGNSTWGSGPGWGHVNFDAPHPAVLIDNGYLHVPCHQDEQGHYLKSGSVECDDCGMTWDGTRHRLYPRIEVGTRLWVRETWAAHFIWSGCSAEEMFGAFGDGTCLFYQADGDDAGSATGGCASDQREKRWRSPMFMPRWASRLTLEVTDVRVERVQKISEADAIAEGCDELDHIYLPECPDCRGYGVVGPDCDHSRDCKYHCSEPIGCFAARWDALNAKRGYSWESNPWVWVYEFKVTEPTP
jgi:hypothetical protein